MVGEIKLNLFEHNRKRPPLNKKAGTSSSGGGGGGNSSIRDRRNNNNSNRRRDAASAASSGKDRTTTQEIRPPPAKRTKLLTLDSATERNSKKPVALVHRKEEKTPHKQAAGVLESMFLSSLGSPSNTNVQQKVRTRFFPSIKFKHELMYRLVL